jgi:hypothetical protein
VVHLGGRTSRAARYYAEPPRPGFPPWALYGCHSSESYRLFQESDEEPPEVDLYCPDCAEREFGGD